MLNNKILETLLDTNVNREMFLNEEKKIDTTIFKFGMISNTKNLYKLSLSISIYTCLIKKKKWILNTL